MEHFAPILPNTYCAIPPIGLHRANPYRTYPLRHGEEDVGDHNDVAAWVTVDRDGIVAVARVVADTKILAGPAVGDTTVEAVEPAGIAYHRDAAVAKTDLLLQKDWEHSHAMHYQKAVVVVAEARQGPAGVEPGLEEAEAQRGQTDSLQPWEEEDPVDPQTDYQHHPPAYGATHRDSTAVVKALKLSIVPAAAVHKENSFAAAVAVAAAENPCRTDCPTRAA